jgi:hypothetical protein
MLGSPLVLLPYSISVNLGVAVQRPLDDLVGRHGSYIPVRFLWTGVRYCTNQPDDVLGLHYRMFSMTFPRIRARCCTYQWNMCSWQIPCLTDLQPGRYRNKYHGDTAMISRINRVTSRTYQRGIKITSKLASLMDPQRRI